MIRFVTMGRHFHPAETLDENKETLKIVVGFVIPLSSMVSSYTEYGIRVRLNYIFFRKRLSSEFLNMSGFRISG